MSTILATDVIPLRFRLNGEPVETTTTADTSLTRVLRDTLSRTETKVGCEAGRCGAGMVPARGFHALGNGLQVAGNLGRSFCFI